MKRTAIAIATMIGAIVLARYGSGQQPGQPGRGGPQNPLLQAFDTDLTATFRRPRSMRRPRAPRARHQQGRQADADELPRAKAVRGGAGRAPGAGGGQRLTSRLCPRTMARSDPRGARAGPRRRAYANVSTADGRLLRQLAESLGARRIVELGTSTGESGLWFSMALRKTGGKLYTHDIDPGRIAVARENFKKAGVEDLIIITEGDAHETATRTRTRSTSSSSTPRRRATTPTSRNCCPTSAPAG